MLTRWTLVDFETIAAPDALDQYPPVEADPKLLAELETPVEADKRLTDPAKIAADIARKTAAKSELPARIAEDIEKRKAALLDSAALDPDACRVICVGIREHDGTEHVILTPDEDAERTALRRVWQSINRQCPMLGYGVSFFDSAVLVRRSQLLGVPVPSGFYGYGKFKHDWIVDLADFLTFGGRIDQRKGRGLEYHCRRFGIQVEDAHSGKDVAQLWRDGNLDAIAAHCAADLERGARLAERLDVITIPPPAELLAFPVPEEAVL